MRLSLYFESFCIIFSMERQHTALHMVVVVTAHPLFVLVVRSRSRVVSLISSPIRSPQFACLVSHSLVSHSHSHYKNATHASWMPS